jgi:hypothetical protein
VYNNLEQLFTHVFGAMFAIMESGAQSLFVIGIYCSLFFILMKVFGAMQSGGGAGTILAIGFQIFIVAGLAALVIAFIPFMNAVNQDFNAYAARAAGVNGYIGGDFSPNGILTENDMVTSAIYAQGGAGPWWLHLQMTVYKVVAEALVQFGSGILAIDLLFADISFYAVVGTVGFLIGMIMNPWLNTFAMEVVKLLAGALVFKVAVGVFVGIGGLVATFTLNYINALHPGVFMSGPDMIYVGMVTAIFALLAVIIPGALAWRICGGVPIFQIGNVIGAVRSGAASVRLR